MSRTRVPGVAAARSLWAVTCGNSINFDISASNPRAKLGPARNLLLDPALGFTHLV